MMMAELTGPAYALTAADAGAITLPCLVLAGTTSHPAPRAIAVALANALPRARLPTVDGSGHVIYAERPEEFAAAVAAFATEVAGAFTDATASWRRDDGAKTNDGSTRWR